MTNFLNEVQLNKLVPSVFATGGSQHVSDKYSFIPTIDVIRGLGENGFHPVAAFQSRTRNEDKKNHVKHIMRFRHENSCLVGGVMPEIVMVNSHDGSSSYQLRAGVYRLVCSNGMIVGDDLFCRRVRHQGDVISSVVEAASDLINIVPISVTKALDWQSIELNQEQKTAYAQVAMSLKWDSSSEIEEDFPLTTNQILAPRRAADNNKNDLWTTFNVIQENIIRGGIRYRNENGSRQRTRAVNSVNENVRLNTALWTLTEKMAELAK